MSNIINLHQKITETRNTVIDANRDNFKTDVELSTEEQAIIDKMKSESALVLTDVDTKGKTTEIPVAEYASSLDSRVATVTGADGTDAILKMVNAGDIVKTTDTLSDEVRNRALEMFRSMSTRDLSEDDIIGINNTAIAKLSEVFPKNDAEQIIKVLDTYSFSQLMNLLPNEFLTLYLTEDDMRSYSHAVKEKLLTVISYLWTVGPDMDHLNKYIEDENKLIMVSGRLLECQQDLAEAIKDPAKLSELVALSRAFAPEDKSVWSKYIKVPNMIHNTFAQSVVIHMKYIDAYNKILEEYPDIPGNEGARELIQSEIDESGNKVATYTSICDLDFLAAILDNMHEEFINAGKKFSVKTVIERATSVINRIRKSKIDIPFPSYDGTVDNPDVLLSRYILQYGSMIKGYNDTLNKLRSNEDDDSMDDVLNIAINGYAENDVIQGFSLVLLLAMGRILKSCIKEPITKDKAITADAYFNIFCKLGTDIYLMSKVWAYAKPAVQVYLDRWYLPEIAKMDKRKG